MLYLLKVPIFVDIFELVFHLDQNIPFQLKIGNLRTPLFFMRLPHKRHQQPLYKLIDTTQCPCSILSDQFLKLLQPLLAVTILCHAFLDIYSKLLLSLLPLHHWCNLNVLKFPLFVELPGCQDWKCPDVGIFKGGLLLHFLERPLLGVFAGFLVWRFGCSWGFWLWLGIWFLTLTSLHYLYFQ